MKRRLRGIGLRPRNAVTAASLRRITDRPGRLIFWAAALVCRHRSAVIRHGFSGDHADIREIA